MYIFIQCCKVCIVILPGVIPHVAAYIQYDKGNEYWYLWSIGGAVIALALALTYARYGWEAFINL
jgi:hypothetical protein